jgi:predicted dehydrogenase
LSKLIAVASRDEMRAAEYAREQGIPKSYGSYDALLQDPEIDAVFIALPNHKHAMWAQRAMAAGKHVLCEKPLAMDSTEVLKMIAVRNRARVKAGEAFMVACHPQWHMVRDLVQSGRIGEVCAIQSSFCFMLTTGANIRNVADYGGGALMDIGCYVVFLSRFVLGKEPVRAFCTMEYDPDSQVDRLNTGVLDFGGTFSSFISSIRAAFHQRVVFVGTKGRIEVEVPLNPPVEHPARVILDDEVLEAPVCVQQALQFDAFSKAILEDGEVPVTLENALGNMRVLDALRLSAASGGWERV